MLLDAFDETPDAVTDDGCTAWRVELTGTFELTEAILWDTDVPLTVTGPVGASARLEAVPAAPATVVEHRILLVDTWPTR